MSTIRGRTITMGAASTQIVAVYELPVGLIMAGECLGLTAQASVSGHKGEVVLPSAGWSAVDRPPGDYPSGTSRPATRWSASPCPGVP